MAKASLWHVASLLSVGCATPAPTAPTTPTAAPVAVPASAAPVAAAPAITPCEALNREQRAALRPFFDEHRRAFGSFDGREFVKAMCWEDAKGAWGLSLVDVRVSPSVVEPVPFRNDTPPVVSGKMQLVRLSTDGARTSTPPGPLHFAQGTSFDWNGDGVAELALPTGEGADATIDVFTLGAHGIQAYAPADGVRVRQVDDIDGDKRPDLLFTAPYEGGITLMDGPMDASRVHTPDAGGFWLLAHARADGTFSRDDPEAIAFAKKGCPSGSLVADKTLSGGWETLELATVVRCARLWGKSQKVVDAHIDKQCRKAKSCPDLKVMRAWAAATPPLVLRD